MVQFFLLGVKQPRSAGHGQGENMFVLFAGLGFFRQRALGGFKIRIRNDLGMQRATFDIRLDLLPLSLEFETGY